MNLFAVDPCPVVSARSLADRHVVKMAVETAQVLWTALHLSAPDALPEGGYRPTHRAHPVVRWTALSRANAAWTAEHGLALCAEYAHRYGRVHGSLAPTERALALLDLLPDGPRTPFALALDDDLRDPGDPHGSIRRYLARKYAAWGSAARWTRRDPPAWAPGSLVAVEIA